MQNHNKKSQNGIKGRKSNCKEILTGHKEMQNNLRETQSNHKEIKNCYKETWNNHKMTTRRHKVSKICRKKCIAIHILILPASIIIDSEFDFNPRHHFAGIKFHIFQNGRHYLWNWIFYELQLRRARSAAADALALRCFELLFVALHVQEMAV